ncbi:ABC transporter ATP-binding protein [Lentzea sp. NPDC006480]|uniref:ABC transporter ATP-binding protein n=1 Tax=Lentzea sp. NPDC006480 TaxID=3157176 RepID=UPI0033A51C06
MTEPAVVVRSLVREYGRSKPRRALDTLDLDVQTGEVHGLLGPNGAGKTTLCKILSTVLLPTSGEALVGGHDVVRAAQAVRSLVGIVLGGERGLYTRLSPRQNLRYWAALYGVTGRQGRQRADELLDRVGLTDRADERVETFSRGMKQRLHLARGLVGDPKVVLLDEPTVGMDPVAAREFRTLVAQLRDEGRTLLITTHDMAEAQAVCDRVSLIDNGRLVGTADPRTIGDWISQYERVTAWHVPDEAVERLRALPTVSAVHSAEGGSVRVETNATGAVADVLRLLADAGVTEVATGRPTLEEVYLHVVGDRGLVV